MTRYLPCLNDALYRFRSFKVSVFRLPVIIRTWNLVLFSFQIFSVALLLVARQYSHYSRNQSLANSREPLQLFFSLANLMEQMPIQGDDTKAAWILLLDHFERWIGIRTIDGKSNDIDDVHIELRRKLTSQVDFHSLINILCYNLNKV